MTKRAQEEGNIILPQEYFLIDISFLSILYPGEYNYLENERMFFHNYNKGRLIEWPLHGDGLGPWNFTINDRTELAKTLPQWQYDDIPYKVFFLRKRLMDGLNNVTLPIVMYIHGGEGKDRTAELAGSYCLSFKNQSFDYVWQFNSQLGMSSVDNENALAWYCEWAAYTLFNEDPEFFCTHNTYSTTRRSHSPSSRPEGTLSMKDRTKSRHPNAPS
eukprot:TRINITY_DN9947_c0_g1_i2.p1 TRINITY_DN9947_c0_g1~~TRINITY_DN9947_c0_g1_i2.p1  ORF type:complete len:216 (+),score=32.77 TRINITY_DN9947_c0_g1_i2:206-853(+)